jgi:hypothetical protein
MFPTSWIHRAAVLAGRCRRWQPLRWLKASLLASGMGLAGAAHGLTLGFEPGAGDGTDIGVGLDLPPAAGAIRIDCTVARTGRCSQRFEVYDSPDYVAHGAHRAEGHTLRARNAHYCEGTRYDLRFSVRLSGGWRSAVRGGTASLWQFKRTQSRPDAFLALRDGRLILRIGPAQSATLLDTIPRERWLDVSIAVDWSTGADGGVAVAIRDARDVRLADVAYRGATLTDAAGVGYMKWGTYKPDWKDAEGSVDVVWVDDVDLQVRNACP